MPAKVEWKGLDKDLKKLLKPYTVKVDAPYASYIEYGTDLHPVSREGIKELTDWAHNKLSISYDEAESVAYSIANKIRHEGTDPQPFFRPAIQKVETMISAGAFDHEPNPIEAIANNLAIEMSRNITKNGTSNTGHLARAILVKEGTGSSSEDL